MFFAIVEQPTVTMAKPKLIKPDYITTGNQVMIPDFLGTPPSYEASDERLWASLFSVESLSTLSEVDREIQVKLNSVWPGLESSSSTRIRREYQKLQERINNTGIKLVGDHARQYFKNTKETTILPIEQISLTDENTIIIKFSESLISLLNKIRLRSKELDANLIYGDISVITSSKSKFTLKLYLAICQAQMTRNTLEVGDEEFLDIIGSQSTSAKSINNFQRIKERYINTIHEQLANTKASFTFKRNRSRKTIIFKFRSNEEILGDLESNKYGFIDHLRNAKVNEAQINHTCRFVADTIWSEQYVNFTIISSYEKLTANGRCNNKPGAFIWKALSDGFFKEPFEKGGKDLIYTLPEIPNCADLVAGKRSAAVCKPSTISIDQANEKETELKDRNSSEVLKTVYVKLFNNEDKFILDYVIHMNIAHIVMDGIKAIHDNIAKRKTIEQLASDYFINNHTKEWMDFLKKTSADNTKHSIRKAFMKNLLKSMAEKNNNAIDELIEMLK